MLKTIDINDGIVIIRDQNFISAGVSLFDWLHRLGQDQIVVLNDKRSRVITLNKKPDEVIKLDFDYEPIGTKFYEFKFSRDRLWHLNRHELLLFMQCCHAGHYYLNQQDYNIGDNRDNINWLYNIMCFNLKLSDPYQPSADT